MINCQEMLVSALNFHKAGQIKEAEELYKKVLQKDSGNDIALNYYGVLCFQSGKVNEAIDFITKAIQKKPLPDYYKTLADIYMTQNRKSEAIHCYQNALNGNPDDPTLLYNIGLLFYQEGQFDDALKCFKAALQLDPNNADINYITGLIYHNKRELNEAANHYIKTINANPANVGAHLNLGHLFFHSGRTNDAEMYYLKALELDPNNSQANSSLASCYKARNDIDKALQYFQSALDLDSSNHFARFYLGCLMMYKGDFDKGWELYDDGRINLWSYQNLKFPESIKPKWNGQPLEGKTVYVYETGGIGDTIHFARYLPVLASMGAKVICKQRHVLDELFRENDLKVEVIDNSVPDETLEFDYQIPYMSLPRAFKANFENIPYKDGFLKANSEKAKNYKEKYFGNNLFKVGIMWQGSGGNPARNVPLKCFLELAKIPNVQLYSFQKEISESELVNLPNGVNIVDIGKTLNNFSDTAAAADNLDLAITIDTAFLHLCAGMGKQTWGLIPYEPDWRWFTDIDYSPWYTSLKLFRQTEPTSWDGIIKQVYNSLNEINLSRKYC